MSGRADKRMNDSVYNQHYAPHLRGSGNNRFAGNLGQIDVLTLETYLRRKLIEIAANRFKWSGMPSSIDVRFLELTLFKDGLSVFWFNPDINKYLAMKATSSGHWNMLDNPVEFTVTGSNFPSRRLSAVPRVLTQTLPNGEKNLISVKEECVPIWANYLRMPDIDTALIYASRIAQLDRTVDINAKNARHTKVIATDEDQRLSAENINRQLENGDSVVEITSQARGLLPTALDLGMHPDMLEKVHIVRSRLWNEAMGMLGINNANQDKKERLVSGEVDANNDQVSMIRSANLNARKEAAHKINRRYGLNVSVEYNTEIDEQVGSIDYSNYTAADSVADAPKGDMK